MMGIKERNFRPLPEDLSLEVLVPKDNFYRRLEERIDLSFVRDFCWCSRFTPEAAGTRLIRWSSSSFNS